MARSHGDIILYIMKPILFITFFAYLVSPFSLTILVANSESNLSFKESDEVPSEYWPLHVNTTKDLVVTSNGEEDKIIPENTRAVVIRLESEGGLLLDFGREGIHRLDPEDTDFLDASHRIANGEVEKLYSIMAGMIAQRLSVPTEDGSGAPYSFKIVSESRLFILLYVDDDADLFRAIAEFELSNREALREKAVALILMPTFNYKNSELSKRLYSYGVRVPFMYDFLVKPYINMLSHQPVLPAIVVTDSNGKIINRHEGSSEEFMSGLRLESLELLKSEQEDESGN